MTDRQGNSATMQSIRILQSWRLQGCKNYRHCNVALLGKSRKAAVTRRRKAAHRPQDGKPPAGRKTCLQVAFLIGLPVKSAFALLSQKVTKAMRRIRRSLPDREKGKFIEADNQRYDRERLCQPQQQKIPRKEH